jgi:hypothetical protein
MSDETPRPTSPFNLTGPYVPPRFQQGTGVTAMQLGPLAFLNGSWRGPGFNAIWRPHNQQSEPKGNKTKRFLELNLTNDGFDFHIIPAVVPNRGLDPQQDLSLYGLHYLQRVSDADPKPSRHVHPHHYSQTAGQALHIEPGLFMYVPASSQPCVGETPIVNKNAIVRMGSIPHGTTVLMQGPSPSHKPKPGRPDIPHLFPLRDYPGAVAPGNPGTSFPPYPTAPQVLPVPPGPNPPALGIQPLTLTGGQHPVPEVNIELDTLVGPPVPPAVAAAAANLSSGPYPEHFQHFIDDPNSVLRDAIEHQDILGHIEIHLTTDTLSADGKPTEGIGSLYETVSNIPFLGVATRTPPPGGSAPPAPSAFQAAPIPNAFVYSASATFWIEWVRIPDYPILKTDPGPAFKELEPFWPEGTYLQLQYSQLVILIFNGVLWPHVTVATMTLSAG